MAIDIKRSNKNTAEALRNQKRMPAVRSGAIPPLSGEVQQQIRKNATTSLNSLGKTVAKFGEAVVNKNLQESREAAYLEGESLVQSGQTVKEVIGDTSAKSFFGTQAAKVRGAEDAEARQLVDSMYREQVQNMPTSREQDPIQYQKEMSSQFASLQSKNPRINGVLTQLSSRAVQKLADVQLKENINYRDYTTKTSQFSASISALENVKGSRRDTAQYKANVQEFNATLDKHVYETTEEHTNRMFDVAIAGFAMGDETAYNETIKRGTKFTPQQHLRLLAERDKTQREVQQRQSNQQRVQEFEIANDLQNQILQGSVDPYAFVGKIQEYEKRYPAAQQDVGWLAKRNKMLQTATQEFKTQERTKENTLIYNSGQGYKLPKEEVARIQQKQFQDVQVAMISDPANPQPFVSYLRNVADNDLTDTQGASFMNSVLKGGFIDSNGNARPEAFAVFQAYTSTQINADVRDSIKLDDPIVATQMVAIRDRLAMMGKGVENTTIEDFAAASKQIQANLEVTDLPKKFSTPEYKESVMSELDNQLKAPWYAFWQDDTQITSDARDELYNRVNSRVLSADPRMFAQGSEAAMETIISNTIQEFDVINGQVVDKFRTEDGNTESIRSRYSEFPVLGDDGRPVIGDDGKVVTDQWPSDIQSVDQLVKTAQDSVFFAEYKKRAGLTDEDANSLQVWNTGTTIQLVPVKKDDDGNIVGTYGDLSLDMNEYLNWNRKENIAEGNERIRSERNRQRLREANRRQYLSMINPELSQEDITGYIEREAKLRTTVQRAVGNATGYISSIPGKISDSVSSGVDSAAAVPGDILDNITSSVSDIFNSVTNQVNQDNIESDIQSQLDTMLGGNNQ